MRTKILVVAGILLSASQMAAQAPSQPSASLVAGPRPGDRAPDFSLMWATADTIGPVEAPFRLSDQRGTVVVAAFLPRARTPTTTRQLEMLAERDSVFSGQVQFVGILPDAPAVARQYAEIINSPFRFLSDEDQRVAVLYGSRAEENVNRRTIYVIGYTGDVVYRDLDFDPDQQSEWSSLAEAVEAARNP